MNLYTFRYKDLDSDEDIDCMISVFADNITEARQLVLDSLRKRNIRVQKKDLMYTTDGIDGSPINIKTA
jgi:hypothetical protein